MAKRTTRLPEVPEPKPGAATVTQDYSAALRPLLVRFIKPFVPADRLDETVAAAALQLYNGAREAWIATRGGTAEHGGVLILGADGRPYWRAGGSASTDAEGRSRFTNERSLAEGETLLATVHTHPASTPPSPEDLANLVLAPEPLKMVRTQDALYVVEQTAEFHSWLEGEAAKYGASVPAVAAFLGQKIERVYEDIAEPAKFYGLTEEQMAERRTELEAALPQVAQEIGLRFHKVTRDGAVLLGGPAPGSTASGTAA